MDKYEAADKELAELLGWHRFVNTKVGLYGDCPTDNKVYQPVPRWTLDDGEAFRLACEYSADVGPELQEDYWDGVGDDCVRMQFRYDSLAQKQQAVRIDVVEEVIHKLKGSV